MKDKILRDHVAAIIRDVREEGDKAVSRFTLKYDGAVLKPSQFRVKPSETGGTEKLPAPLRAAIDKAAANIRRFHAAELKHIKLFWTTGAGGAKAGQRLDPVASAGIYVPGGRFSYPSTVLMTAIPAKAAGVKKVVIATPPNNITPALIYAARAAGVTEIYRIGGPWAVAALAFGTGAIPRVDLIAGPGNKFVNEAKRQVYGTVGIDSLAGPSEIAIIADRTARAGYIACDILAQLEHDPDARAYMFTDSAALLKSVKQHLYGKAGKLRFRAVKCTLKKAAELAEALAPEHLEIAARQAQRIAAGIRSAGAVFIGRYSPVAAGDYWAGPSHTLPTGGSARFSSGLSAATFLRRTSVIELNRKAFLRAAPHIRAMASAEGLLEHARSVEIREKRK